MSWLQVVPILFILVIALLIIGYCYKKAYQDGPFRPTGNPWTSNPDTARGGFSEYPEAHGLTGGAIIFLQRLFPGRMFPTKIDVMHMSKPAEAPYFSQGLGQWCLSDEHISGGEYIPDTKNMCMAGLECVSHKCQTLEQTSECQCANGTPLDTCNARLAKLQQCKSCDKPYVQSGNTCRPPTTVQQARL